MTMDTRQFDTMVGRRQMPRIQIALPGTFAIANEQNPCLLNDLSRNGAGVSLAVSAPPLGVVGALSLNGIEVSGVVAWRSRTRFGLKFEQLLPQYEMDRLSAIHNRVEALGSRSDARACIVLRGRPWSAAATLPSGLTAFRNDLAD